MTVSRAPRSAGLLMLVVLLLAFALRAYHLDFQSFWSDEGISLLRARLPLGEMLRTMPVEHAPGYFVLLHVWLRLTGESDFAVRFLSLWPSVVAVVLVYRLATDLGSRVAGLVAALLLATNAFQVWYAQEARMYSWLLATSLGSTWMLWVGGGGRVSGIGERARRLSVLGYVLVTAATIYLHHYGFLVPMTHVVFMVAWLWYHRRTVPADLARREVLRWVIAAGGVGLLYLPWLPHFLGIFGFPGWRDPLDPSQLPWRYLAAYTVGDAMPAPGRAWLPWLYLLLALAGALAWWRRRPMVALLLVCGVLVPLGGALALALRQPDFHERYTIMISAPLLLLVAGGFSVFDSGRFGAPSRARRHGNEAAERQRSKDAKTRLQKLSASLRLRGSAFQFRDVGWVDRLEMQDLLAGLLLAGLIGANALALQRLYTDSSLHKPNFRAAAQRVARMEAPGDVVLVDGPDPEKVFLHYYHGTSPVHDLRPLQGASAPKIDAALAAATAGGRRAWGLRYFHEPGPVQAWLARQGWTSGRTDHNGIDLTLYGLAASATVERSLGLAFERGLTLLAAEVGGEQRHGDTVAVRAGDLLRVTTRWEVETPVPARKFSLRLQDTAGRVWMAGDYIPQDGFAPTERWQPGEPAFDRHGLWLPPDLPPGRYQVTLRLYDPATGAPVETPAGPDVPLVPVDLLPAAAPPDPATLPIATRLNRALGDDLTLLGFEIAPARLRPGQVASLTLWWRADRRPAQSYQVEVALVDRQGELAARQQFPLSLAPVHEWEPGQIVRGQYALALDPATTTGPYRLGLVLAGPGGEVVARAPVVATIPVEARPRSYRLPRISRPLDVRLGDAVALRGYDVSLARQPGGEMALTLYWQAQQRVAGRFKVFVHLVNEAGQIAAQSDAIPAGGEAPTESWLPREVVVDRHSLRLPGAGRYRLLVGMYDPISGQRLPAQDVAQGSLPENAVPLEEVVLP